MTIDARWTVMVVDDHPLFRKGLKDLFSMDERFEIAGEASSGEEGLERLKDHHVDLVLLDMNMKGMDGIATLKAIRDAEIDSKVVMLTVSDSDEDVIAGLRAGADGYLLKDMEPEKILERLGEAMEGGVVISDNLVSLLARALRGGTTPQSSDDAQLTPRERETVALIQEGMSNKHIARELDIAEGTVKVHVKHLLKKLKLKSRVEIAVWAVEHLEKRK